MKICYIVETYTKGLGYIDNILPKSLASSGDEVHVITCRLPPYYQNNEDFFGDLPESSGFSPEVNEDGVIVHTQPYSVIGKRVLISGLHTILNKVRPDVVLVRGMSSLVLGQVIVAKLFLRFALFTSTGQAYSAVPLAVRLGRWFSPARLRYSCARFLPGALFSLFVERCIASTEDGRRVATEFYGIPRRKVAVISLGVDTQRFCPWRNVALKSERNETRRTLGLLDGDVVCIWTGRMTGRKLLRVLAEAVEGLRIEGYAFKAIFVGDGPEARDLEGFPGSIHVPFVPWADLPRFYRAADLAAWPCSITTSTLDASASGLPVIMSNGEHATERWEGMGASYIEGSVESMKDELRRLYDPDVRHTLGQVGAEVMKRRYSWDVVAAQFRKEFTRK